MAKRALFHVALRQILPLFLIAIHSGLCRCPDKCNKNLGISDYRIRDDQMSANSAYDNDFATFGAHRARLNLTSWPPGYRANNEPPGTFLWLKVNLDQAMAITGIATQGYGNSSAEEWVSMYMMLYEKGDGLPFFTEIDGESLKTFTGNFDAISIQYNEIPFPVVTSSVTLYPTFWNNNFGLRMELYGCKPEFHFVAWITISNSQFTLEYADSKNEAYLALRKEVITEVTDLLAHVPGFLLADLRTFSPQLVMSRAIMSAEIKVYCIQSRKNAVAQHLRESIHNGDSSMFSEYLNTEDRFDCQCDIPSVVMKLPKSLENATIVYTNKLFFFRATFRDNCNTPSDYKHYWELSECDENAGECGPMRPYGREWSPAQKSKMFYPRLFAVGYLYIRCVFRSSTENYKVKSYDYGYIRLILPSLVAKIKGPVRVIRGNHTHVVLDASESYDPDRTVLKTKGMSLNWFCKEESEEFDIGEDPVTGSPSTDEPGNCYDLTGKVNNSLPVLYLNLQNVKGNRTYAFKVVIQKGDRTSQATHKLRVDEPFVFSIGCISNCGAKVSVNQRFTLKTACSGLLCHRILKYNWALFKLRTTGGKDWDEVTNLNENILTDIDSPNLVIPGGKRVLQENHEYRIRALVTLNNGFTIAEEITFVTNSPPRASYGSGGCFVTPSEGFVLTTEFNISCSGWMDADLPLNYEFRYQTGSGVLVFNSGPASSAIARLPLGSITVEVRVSDSLGASTIQRYQVQVNPIPTGDISKVLESSASDEDSQLLKLVNGGKVDQAAQMAYSILTAVEDADVDTSNKREFKGAILEQISTVEVNSMQQVTQLSAVVVMATKGDKDIAASSQENAVGLLENMTDFLSSQVNTEGQNVDLIQDVGGSLLQGMSNSLSASAPRASSNAEKLDENDQAEDEDSVEEDRKQNEQIAKKTLQLIDKLGTGLLATKVLGEKPSVFVTEELSVMLDRQTPSKMSGKTLGEGKEKVSLPSAETLFGHDSANLPSVDAQMTSFNKNPFTWDESAKGIQSSVVDFSLKRGDGTSLEISGLKDPVELFIPVTRPDEKSGNRSQAKYFAKPSNGSSNIRYHRIDIPSVNSIVFCEIKPEHGQFFEVFVRAQKKPTPIDYQYRTRVPDFSTCVADSKGTGYHNCSDNPYEFSITSDVTGKTGVHYIGIMFAANKIDKTRGRVARSCGGHGGRQKRSCIGVKDPPTTPPPTAKIIIPQYNASTDVNYTVSVTVTSCLYWSEKKQAWTNEGCSIGPKTNSESLHCLCTHLSAFGGDFFVAPNPIDFDKVFAEFGRLGESGNFVVLATVCSIFGAYVLGLVFAQKADKIDEMKVVGNVYLSDNVYSSGCVYKLHVQTGMWRNQGTTANVGIVLYGEEGCSGPILLSDSNARRILFARGSVNSFTFTLPSSLGRLFKILIWHDNSGESPAWFLQQVEIEDSNTGDKWYFLANRWLALEKGSGEIEFEINAADKKDLAKFKNLFVFRTARSLGDGHLWLSVFTRPPHVSFTRCQRLSCCLSVLFTAMVTNAMFYNFGASPKDSFQVGPLKLSWTQIKIGIQSSLIAIPINVLVVMIFRNTKPKSQEHVYKVRLEEIEEKAPGCLPHFFVYIGWALCILTSLTAAAFIVFYSMMWGKETSNQWLTSITVSFIQDVFVSQPIKVILLASLLSLIIKKPPEREKVYGVTFKKEDRHNKTVTGPPQGEELEKARDFRAKVQGMYKVLAEVTVFVMFVMLLMIVCYGNRGVTRYVLTNSMEDAFKNFKGRNISSFWRWMQSQLLPALYDTRWYNGWMFDYDEGFVGNRELFMVGMPRLRQVRISPANVCQVSEKVPQLGESFTRCIPSYSSKNEYKILFNLPEWIPVTNMSQFQSVFQLERMCPGSWRYRSSEELQTLSYQGVYSSYDGGGFVADLGYNIKSASNILKKLMENNWIDDFSVAIFIEFTVFNPSSSLFSVVRCLYERFPTGGVAFSRSVKTLTLYKSSSDNFQRFYEVCQLLFMVIILIFVVSEICKIYRQRKKYFTGFWNWVELLQILTAVCAVVMFFLKAKYTSSFVKRVRNNPFETSSADYIVLWSTVEVYVLSFLIFIVTMKFLRLMRFNRHVCQMMGTLARSVNPLVSFFIVFVAAVLAYTQMAFLLFGSTLDPYSSFFDSLRAVLQMLLGGKMFFYELKSTDNLLGPLFVFLYMFTMTLILLNMFLAILNESYTEVVECPGNDFANADLGAFTIAYLHRNANLLARRFVLFLKKPCKDKKVPRQGKSKGWRKKESKQASEITSLFSTKVEGERSIKTVCPMASMDSLTGIDDTIDEDPEKIRVVTFKDSGNVTLSLLSIHELYESKEDEDINVLLQEVKDVESSLEFIPGVTPLRPIRESIV